MPGLALSLSPLSSTTLSCCAPSPLPHLGFVFWIPYSATHSFHILRILLLHLVRSSCPRALLIIHLYTPHSTNLVSR